jgi:hypothetical protein
LQEGSPEFARKQRADIRDRYRKRRTNDDQLGGQMFAGYNDVFNG